MDLSDRKIIATGIEECLSEALHHFDLPAFERMQTSDSQMSHRARENLKLICARLDLPVEQLPDESGAEVRALCEKVSEVIGHRVSDLDDRDDQLLLNLFVSAKIFDYIAPTESKHPYSEHTKIVKEFNADQLSALVALIVDANTVLGDHELDMLNDRESVLWTTMLSLAETLGPDLLKLETELAELDTGKVVQERNSGRIINAAAPANRIALKLELLGRTACAEAVPVIDDTITDHLATLRQEDIDQDRQVWNRTLIAAKSALQRLRSSGVDVNHELLD